MILALFERLGVDESRELRACARADRGDEARLRGAQPDRHRFRPICAKIPRACSPRSISIARPRSSIGRRPRLSAARCRSATRCGWARSTATASRSATSRAPIGSSARAASCRAPGSSCKIAASSFSLDPAALNPLEPGRRPFHTLNPPLALFKDGRIMSYGAMGGDGQPQFQAELFTRHVLFGQTLARGHRRAALAARAHLGQDRRSTSRSRTVSTRAWCARSSRRATPCIVLDRAYDEGLGHAGALMRHRTARSRRRMIRARTARALGG